MDASGQITFFSEGAEWLALWSWLQVLSDFPLSACTDKMHGHVLLFCFQQDVTIFL